MRGKKSGIASAWTVAFFSFAILLLLQGCFWRRGEAKPEEVKKPKQASEAYSRELKEWTRSKKIYEGFESKLYINATYKSPAFRKAYIDLYADSYQLESSYKHTMLERELEEAEKYNEFFFTAFTPEEKWNDFSNPDSIWRLYLEDSEGAKLAPISVTKLAASDPILREFFPYFDPWSSAYIAKFPKYTDVGTEPIPGPGTKFVKLTVTGILGKGELEWRLKDK